MPTSGRPPTRGATRAESLRRARSIPCARAVQARARRSRAVGVVVLLLTLPALAASAQDAPWALTPAEKAYLEARGPIVMIHNRGSAPLSFSDASDGGRGLGIGPDLRRLMEVRLGLRFALLMADNGTDMIARMLAGEAEVGATLSPTPEREKVLSFTEPYMVLETWVWGPPHAHELSENGFAGSTLAVVGRSSTEPIAAKEFPQATILRVPSTRLALDAVATGKAVAMVGSLPVLAYESARNTSLQGLGPLGEPLEAISISFSVQKSDPVLFGIIQKGLRSISPEERKAIFIKWTGHDLSPQGPVAPTVTLREVGIWGLVSLGVVVAVATPIWIVTLRRKVAARTHELRDLNLDLDARVKARTAELEATNRELEEFAYNVSHDLRAPLRAMDGFATILQTEHDTDLTPEMQRYLAIVKDSSREMSTLVEDLLAFAHLGRVELHVERVEPEPMVRKILDTLQAANPHRKVEAAIEPLPPCDADPTLLRQVFSNLLDNAFKFTRQRTRAHIEVGFNPILRAYYVKDDGIGFEMRHAGHLFGVFQRMQRRDEYEGNGIGLAKVKRIVEAHHGRVWAEAAVDRGATFYFTIPAPSKATPGAIA